MTLPFECKFPKVASRGFTFLALGASLLIPSASFAADLDDAAFSKAMDKYLAKDENVEKLSNSIEDLLIYNEIINKEL